MRGLSLLQRMLLNRVGDCFVGSPLLPLSGGELPDNADTALSY